MKASKKCFSSSWERVCYFSFLYFENHFLLHQSAADNRRAVNRQVCEAHLWFWVRCKPWSASTDKIKCRQLRNLGDKFMSCWIGTVFWKFAVNNVFLFHYIQTVYIRHSCKTLNYIKYQILVSKLVKKTTCCTLQGSNVQPLLSWVVFLVTDYTNVQPL